MTEPKVSERMRDLVITLETDAANYECRGGNYALVELRESRNTLLSAIAEIEQRAEKAEQERDLLMQEPDNRLDGYRELGNQCAMLADRVDKWKEVAVAYKRWRDAYFCWQADVSYKAFTHGAVEDAHKRLNTAIVALGPAWDEAVR